MIGLKTLPQYKTVEAAQPSQYNMAWREQTMEANFIYEINLWVCLGLLRRNCRLHGLVFAVSLLAGPGETVSKQVIRVKCNQ